MTSNLTLSPDLFSDFFWAVWGYKPFPWQVQFASRICANDTPEYVTVPTGSGKTACLDAAVFALGVQASLLPEKRTAGRRIFFIVNRRVIVDEAFQRARDHLVPALRDPARHVGERQDSQADKARAIEILTLVSSQLRSLSETDDPLACVELRGGIYRDGAWAKSLLQPMIICSTVDQAGSRLLFRGYGVSLQARPVHAALVAHDSLLLIDEAHIVQPFLHTLDSIRRYRTHVPTGGETVSSLPFSVVKMTATPPKDVPDSARLGLTQADRDHPVLSPRLLASKKASLVHAAAAKGKLWMEKLAAVLQEQANAIITSQTPGSIAIMVNRVATAREVYALMKKKHPEARVHLLLGRMRPIDRDDVTDELQKALKTGVSGTGTDTKLQIVVSTQCLEVGADLDFDALVTECASLDALRQRFGRLNRGGRKIEATAAVVFPEEAAKDASPDPIYGVAILRTWKWLQSQVKDDVVDFGLHPMTEASTAARLADEEAFNLLLTPRANAPILLPAYLDCWVQTNPGPAADPDVAVFLHGPQRDMAEVQVCWRADLPAPHAQWGETVALCPPTSLECLPVPLLLMRQWLCSDSSVRDDSGDAPSDVQEQDRKAELSKRKTAFVWRGDDDSFIVTDPQQIRAGDTVVLRVQDEAWADLGHLPDAIPERVDVAEKGIARLRRKAVVRLHPNVFQAAGEASAKLLDWALKKEGDKDECDWDSPEVKDVLTEAAEEFSPLDPGLSCRLRHLAQTKSKKIEVERYADDTGVVLGGRSPYIDPKDEAQSGLAEDGPNSPLLETPRPQGLETHTAHVRELASTYANALGLVSYHDAISQAATLHDVGKADWRFQAMLMGGDIAAAMARKNVLAKSAMIPTSPQARRRIRLRAGLPEGFSHEMLSGALAQTSAADSLLPAAPMRRALALQLIYGHHGEARPFARAVDDDNPPAVQVSVGKVILELTQRDRMDQPAHALDSGVAERFWQLTRHHGWWGLALLEAVLRIADQRASANPKVVDES